MNMEATHPFLPYLSTEYSREILTKHYQKAGIAYPDKRSYSTCYSFISHLKHGCLYYQQAQAAPLEIKPLLLFYGFIQLMKAVILTKDDQYPANSQVLAHGVTTRKRKKTTYRFLDDEVKIQRNGLFSHFLFQLFHMKHVEGEKLLMKDLLIQIADLHPLFETLSEKKEAFPLKKDKAHILIPIDILDSYHMTANRFTQFLENNIKDSFGNIRHINMTETKEFLKIPSNVIKKKSRTPFLKNLNKNYFLFTEKDKYLPFPEIASHYLLLYNLSMICRYETEWWSDLLSTFDGNDLPFILAFLDIVPQKSIQLFQELLLP
ncbi:YaaC family protein [Alkalihalobacillus sp. 1P02AB]|uniref:YaaC family protein n=1 Tax=Alkalihalobacillus sp. 1P02AB TaxID=3132260 RepID=UPI0039A42217